MRARLRLPARRHPTAALGRVKRLVVHVDVVSRHARDGARSGWFVGGGNVCVERYLYTTCVSHTPWGQSSGATYERLHWGQALAANASPRGGTCEMSGSDRALSAVEVFNEAFNRHDVDAVMKLMTD